MQGNSKGSEEALITVHYNCYLEAFMQGYSKGTIGPS
jgi:hypothetical protein